MTYVMYHLLSLTNMIHYISHLLRPIMMINSSHDGQHMDIEDCVWKYM